MKDSATLKDTVCDIAREDVLFKIDIMAHDRLTQGETLHHLLTGIDDKIDNEIFALYEGYLRQIRTVVKSTPIHL